MVPCSRLLRTGLARRYAAKVWPSSLCSASQSPGSAWARGIASGRSFDSTSAYVRSFGSAASPQEVQRHDKKAKPVMTTKFRRSMRVVPYNAPALLSNSNLRQAVNLWVAVTRLYRGVAGAKDESGLHA